MIVWDVNVLVYAFRRDSPLHSVAYRAVSSTLDGGDQFLFCPTIGASFLRLVTNPRIFVEPSEPAEAWRYLDHLESHRAARYVDIDEQAWAMFRHLSLIDRASGNRVPDALLAALALRYRSTLVTADSGFTRYPGIELSLLTEPAEDASAEREC